jgi:hypothetical protein
MRYIDGKSKWNKEGIALEYKDRFTNYINITNKLDIEDSLCDTKLKIIERIGSGSQNAEVYRGKVNK